MIDPGTFTKRPTIVACTMESRGDAFLRLLADHCHTWPELRQWLFEDFARNAKTQENFKAWVERPRDDNQGRLALAELAAEATAWQREKARLQRRNGVGAPGIYGGRTWQEMEQLVHRYQGGVTELGLFVLARHWRKMGARAKFAPELQRAGTKLLNAVISDGETHLLASLSRTVRVLSVCKSPDLRAMLGYADWWKLQTTLYIMRNPQPAYRTRDLRAHLAGLELNVSCLDFRRFAKRHGIRRDMRAGRPRTARTNSPLRLSSS